LPHRIVTVWTFAKQVVVPQNAFLFSAALTTRLFASIALLVKETHAAMQLGTKPEALRNCSTIGAIIVLTIGTFSQQGEAFCLLATAAKVLAATGANG